MKAPEKKENITTGLLKSASKEKVNFLYLLFLLWQDYWILV